MTNPIIERAARAIVAADNRDPDAIHPLGLGKPQWQHYTKQAEAVLRAIREPSEEMIKAGSCGGDWPHASETWQAMIDAALGDE
ncbi:hypothetical protein INR77_08920 [Erythrobacter sp. SCSIO 43205]|uniref:hypothetical protein n=1 Tax=Erythrobacter sp. SCSIO 43205 TaxID=2779361 RepID=UPI001CA7CA7A|nr:hypothetical protein [Erythrobacter sp. SCSIO 43205]UAB76969.1 hypothetical protein INR77_08920 [Erythrobacter sp. SCSIO 43205]